LFLTQNSLYLKDSQSTNSEYISFWRIFPIFVGVSSLITCIFSSEGEGFSIHASYKSFICSSRKLGYSFFKK